MTQLQKKWMPVLVAALVNLLTLGSVTYWTLRFFAEPGLQVSASPPVADAQVLFDTASVARVLGGGAIAAAGTATQVTETDSASRFVLRGVVAGGKYGGVALISVDGKPARPVRVGGAVAENLVLQSVVGKTARLGVTNTSDAFVTLSVSGPKQGDAPPDNLETPTRLARNPAIRREPIDVGLNATMPLDKPAREPAIRREQIDIDRMADKKNEEKRLETQRSEGSCDSSPEVRERTVQMLLQHQGYPSMRAAIVSIAPTMGCSPGTLLKWVRQFQGLTDARPGTTTSEQERVKAPE